MSRELHRLGRQFPTSVPVGLLSGNSVSLPELFAPSVRASAKAVTNSMGRLFTAAGP